MKFKNSCAMHSDKYTHKFYKIHAINNRCIIISWYYIRVFHYSANSILYRYHVSHSTLSRPDKQIISGATSKFNAQCVLYSTRKIGIEIIIAHKYHEAIIIYDSRPAFVSIVALNERIMRNTQ